MGHGDPELGARILKTFLQKSSALKDLEALLFYNGVVLGAVVADYVKEAEIKKYGSLDLKGIDESVLSFVVSRDPVE